MEMVVVSPELTENDCWAGEYPSFSRLYMCAPVLSRYWESGVVPTCVPSMSTLAPEGAENMFTSPVSCAQEQVTHNPRDMNSETRIIR